MNKREKIAAQIRALRAKTVDNGCTEAEAMAAAEMLARLLEKHNMTVDEAELRESPFQEHREVHDDLVGARLWKIADGIAHMTGVRYWTGRVGDPPSISFFGFDHEVEIAVYLLEICQRAMTYELDRTVAQNRLLTPVRARRLTAAFLDGMADRLRQRLRALKPAEPVGTGLIVLRNELIEEAMPVKTQKSRPKGSRDFEPSYDHGRRAADLVALNRGVGGNSLGGYLR